MSGWLFVFACAAFVCHGKPLPGDGVLHETKAACVRAAHLYAVRHAIHLGRYEIACVERPA